MRQPLVYATTLLLILLLAAGYLHERALRLAGQGFENHAALVSIATTSLRLLAATSPTSGSAQSTAAPVRIPIFVYHSVEPDYPGETKTQKDFSVTPQEFEAQLQYLLDHGYTTVSLDTLVRDVNLGTTMPIAKPVVLTFDDGWQNQFDYAFPLLKKYGDTATFFIFTNPIGKDKRFMTWAEVQALSAAGMEIGDHTMTHPYLQKLSPDGMKKEILGGKQKLEAEIGKPVVHFASPFGFSSTTVSAILAANGFTTGRTLVWGAEHSKSDLLTLTAYQVQRNLQTFTWMLTKSK